MDDTVAGFDVPKIVAWLSSVTDLSLPVSWERMPGGHSNLTYLLRDATGRELVIRRPPLGELLPKAHDMWREYRIIEGLSPTAVPVAAPIAYCDDRAVAESHFYVMGRVAGESLHSGHDAARFLDEPARRHAGESFIDVLAALHSIEPDDVGLGDLGRREGYVARQLNTWYRSWMASIDDAGYDDPRVHELHAMLSSRIPAQGPARVVHGDYGPHNCLFAANGELTAVLDWEIATLGDPLADFAYSINAWVEPGDSLADGADPPTVLPGFPSRDEMITRYAKATGADLSQLAFYRAFNSLKTALIIQGVYARYRAGKKSTEGVDLATLFARIDLSLSAAASMAAELD